VVEEIDRIGSQTRFNGFALLDGSASGIEIRVGGGAGSADGVALSIEASTADTLGDGTASLRDLDIGTEAGAGDALAVLAAASDQISANRATAGAVSNRLETADRAAAVTIEHAMSAHSQIMDLDIPEGASALSTAAALRKMGLTAVSIQNRQRGMLLDRLV
jgi:flagellin